MCFVYLMFVFLTVLLLISGMHFDITDSLLVRHYALVKCLSQRVLKLVKNFPAFYGTQMFITAFTRARHLSLILSENNPVHASPSHFLKIYFNIAFPSTPRFSTWSLSLGSSDRNRVKCRRRAAVQSVSPSAIDRPNESQAGSAVAEPSDRGV